MVDPGRLPVDDASQPAAVGKQLVFVDVAVDQEWKIFAGGSVAIFVTCAQRGVTGEQ
jgi:hypothetical protein